MKTFLATLSFAIAGLAAAPAVMAADPAPVANPAAGACKADAEKLCPGVQPGDGRIKACFKQHKDQLSPDCKKAIAAEAKKQKGA